MTVHDVAASLPDLPELHDLCLSIAVAEAVLNHGGAYRYYTFGAQGRDGEKWFSMRNGGGDEYDVVFSAAGAYIRGFDHESAMSPYADDKVWPGVLDTVPEVFRSAVEEPAFQDEDMPMVTCCLWREKEDDRWRTGRIDFPEGERDPDGSGWMFAMLTERTPQAFRSWAKDYYERPVDLDAVRDIYEQRPLDEDIVRRLNPKISLADVRDEIRATGYPVRSS
ncbi:hypothetical protein ABT040_18890 [Streptomyces sp. NPDC002688]|uniref:hypothetical protein n=1 Tax=Streptomyces sp. NPDC002688 TaxID=3154423 RepID=UPI0033258F12